MWHVATRPQQGPYLAPGSSRQSQPGKNEHSDRPVGCEHHQVQVEKDHSGCISELRTVPNTCPPSGILSPPRSHTLSPMLTHSTFSHAHVPSSPRPLWRRKRVLGLEGKVFSSPAVPQAVSPLRPRTCSSTALGGVQQEPVVGHTDVATRGWESQNDRARNTFPPTSTFHQWREYQ